MGHSNPFTWSIRVGRWFGTNVRISFLYPLMAVLLCVQLRSLQLGLACALILFVSTLLHEFGHVWAARITGGHADEILIWPLGGLAYVSPRNDIWSRQLTTAAGPLVNLVLMALMLPWTVGGPWGASIWHPFVIPVSQLEASLLVSQLAALTFSLNWMLLVLNLVPILPLDGGRMMHQWLTHACGVHAGNEQMVRVAVLASLALGVTGYLVDQPWLMGASFLLFIMTWIELQTAQTQEQTDESFLGYDFSQGYTSLERSQPAAATQEKKAGLFERWREKRRLERLRREEMEAREVEAELDRILQKLHEQGQSSLTAAERRMLHKASARFRQKDRPAR